MKIGEEDQDFRNWMKPRLRDYYVRKRQFAAKAIQELIPEEFQATWFDHTLGNTAKGLSGDFLDESIYQPLTHYLKARGKLLRPVLCCMLLEGYGKSPDEFKPILVAPEIIHSASLVLDDIVDNSYTRRNQPCAHRVYGIPRAGNASILMTLFAHKLLESNLMPLKPEVRTRIIEAIHYEHFVCGLGTAIDIGWSIERRLDYSFDEYIQHVYMRSSAYTYRHAARISSIAAGANKEDLKYIFDYSSYLGVAFQLIDDIFNLRPEMNSWGKVVSEDLTEGKRSLLVFYTLKKAARQDRDRLMEILDAHTENPDTLQEAVGIMEKYDVFERVRKKATQYIEKAIDCILMTDITNDYKLLLTEFAQYVVDRKI